MLDLRGTGRARLLAPPDLTSTRLPLKSGLGLRGGACCRTGISDLFDDIITKAGLGTLAGNDLILVNTYIAPCLLKYLVFEMTPILAYKYRNKGVVQQTSENSQATSFDDLNHLLNRWRDKAEMFGEDIVRYLIANHTLFPLYTSNSDSDDIYPSNSAFTGGLFLGNGKSRGGFDYLRDCCD